MPGAFPPPRSSAAVVTGPLWRSRNLPLGAGKAALITLDNGQDHTKPNTLGPGSLAELDKALDIVVNAGKASASYLQRRLKIGYNRAARIVEDLEERGIVGPQQGSKPREVIHVPDRFRE